jgi:putative membrane protein
VQPTGEPAAGASADESFAKQMAQSDFAEVEMGRLAEKKSTTEKILAFAREMIEAHTKDNQQLQSVVTTIGISVPSALSESDAAMLQQLEALSGQAFDEAYVRSQVTEHQRVQALLQQELSGGTNAQLKAYAQEALPVINHHLRTAQELASSFSR